MLMRSVVASSAGDLLLILNSASIAQCLQHTKNMYIYQNEKMMKPITELYIYIMWIYKNKKGNLTLGPRGPLRHIGVLVVRQL